MKILGLTFSYDHGATVDAVQERSIERAAMAMIRKEQREVQTQARAKQIREQQEHMQAAIDARVEELRKEGANAGVTTGAPKV